MSWSARIEHTPAGLALTFGAPLSRLDMAPEVAQHLASLLAIEARARVAGVVRTLEAENTEAFPARHRGALENVGNLRARHRATRISEAEYGSRAVVLRTAQPKTSKTHSDTEWLKYSHERVEPTPAHPLCDCDSCLNGDHHA